MQTSATLTIRRRPECRVLLVEADPADAAAVRAACRHARRCRTAGRWRALELAAKRPFDVALADWSLPDAPRGAAVTPLAAHARFPVIVLTGDDGHRVGPQAVRSGAQDYLQKPQLHAPQLQRAIASAIARYEALVQYQRVLQHCPDGILIVGADGDVVFANPAAVAAFGQEVVGSPIGVPIAGVETTEIQLVNGRTAEMRVAPVPWQRTPAYLMLLRDVTDRVRAVSDLERMTGVLEELVVIDPLTRVLNRRGVETALSDLTAVARRSGERGAIVLVDCDDFKGINDTGGYAAGDATLQRVARAISDSVRPGRDRVGRVGGDEFVVLLPNIRLEDAHMVAERIRAAIHNTPPPLTASKNLSPISASVGVAPIAATVSSLNEVIALAQGPLQQSKRSGKNTVRSEGRVRDPLALDIDELLREPLLLGVAAHGIVRPGDGARVGVELLIRGPAGDALESPDAIFMTAKRRHLLSAIDLTCVRRCMSVCRLLSDCTRVNVNLYASTLADTPLDEVLRILRPPGRTTLVLELNEQEFIGEPALIAERLTALRRAGVLIALDDVGYGRSSFEAISALEPDIVKIDRSAVLGLSEDAEKRRVLGRMLKCLQGLSPEIVTEGVETEADARVVIDMGIPLAQGFLWGRPELVAFRSRALAAPAMREHRRQGLTPGSEKTNVAPCPGALSTVISPPCRRRIRRTVARPTPVPETHATGETAGTVRTLLAGSGAKPAPLSDTKNAQVPGGASVRPNAMRPSSRRLVNFQALCSRFSTTTQEAGIPARLQVRLDGHVHDTRGCSRRRCATTVWAMPVRSTGDGMSGLAGARQPAQSVDEGAHVHRGGADGRQPVGYVSTGRDLVRVVSDVPERRPQIVCNRGRQGVRWGRAVEGAREDGAFGLARRVARSRRVLSLSASAVMAASRSSSACRSRRICPSIQSP
ncbi:MAG: EAL domain-containing protein [Vicinamibacterales bacterium]